MATQFEQLRYLRTAAISGAASYVIGYTLLENKTLDEIVISSVPGNVTGDVVFNLQKNGVNLFDDELTIANGTKKIKLTALGIDLLEDDELKLNLVSGSINAPIVLGLGFAEAGGGGGTNATQIQGVDVEDLANVPGFGDDFEGASVNTDKWKNSDGSDFLQGRWTQADGKMKQNNLDNNSPVLMSVQSFTWVDGAYIIFHVDEQDQNNVVHLGLGRFVSGVEKEAQFFRSLNQYYYSVYANKFDSTGGYVSQDPIIQSYYNPTNDTYALNKFLRLRRDGTNLLFESSPTGADGSWTVRKTDTTPTINNSSVQIFVASPQEHIAILEIFTNLGAAGLSDGDDLAYNATAGKLKKRSVPQLVTALSSATNLPELKAALDALP